MSDVVKKKVAPKFVYTPEEAFDVLQNEGCLCPGTDTYGDEAQEFEHCCAVTEIGPFPGGGLDPLISIVISDWECQADYWSSDNDREFPKQPSKTYFKNLVMNALKEDFVDKLSDKGHIYVATLIHNQQWLKPILVAAGFRLVSDRTVNRTTGNRIFFYMRDPVSNKGKKLTKKRF